MSMVCIDRLLANNPEHISPPPLVDILFASAHFMHILSLRLGVYEQKCRAFGQTDVVNDSYNWVSEAQSTLIAIESTTIRTKVMAITFRGVFTAAEVTQVIQRGRRASVTCSKSERFW